MGGVLLSWLKSARLPGRRAATLLPNFNNRRDIPLTKLAQEITMFRGAVGELRARVNRLEGLEAERQREREKPQAEEPDDEETESSGETTDQPADTDSGGPGD